MKTFKQLVSSLQESDWQKRQMMRDERERFDNHLYNDRLRRNGIHKVHVISGSYKEGDKSNDGKIHTQKPEHNEYVQFDQKHGHGAGLFRVSHTKHSYKTGESKTTHHVVRGHQDYKVGDKVSLHDDGNQTTKFGFKRSNHQGVVTAVAKKAEDMKSWDHPGKYNLYHMK